MLRTTRHMTAVQDHSRSSTHAWYVITDYLTYNRQTQTRNCNENYKMAVNQCSARCISRSDPLWTACELRSQKLESGTLGYRLWQEAHQLSHHAKAARCFVLLNISRSHSGYNTQVPLVLRCLCLVPLAARCYATAAYVVMRCLCVCVCHVRELCQNK